MFGMNRVHVLAWLPIWVIGCGVATYYCAPYIIDSYLKDTLQYTEVRFQPGSMGISQSKGIVSKINPNTQASAKGVREGWRFVSINGKRYSDELIKQMAKTPLGTVYSIRFKHSVFESWKFKWCLLMLLGMLGVLGWFAFATKPSQVSFEKHFEVWYPDRYLPLVHAFAGLRTRGDEGLMGSIFKWAARSTMNVAAKFSKLSQGGWKYTFVELCICIIASVNADTFCADAEGENRSFHFIGIAGNWYLLSPFYVVGLQDLTVDKDTDKNK